jgi:hypothetical protein
MLTSSVLVFACVRKTLLAAFGSVAAWQLAEEKKKENLEDRPAARCEG